MHIFNVDSEALIIKAMFTGAKHSLWFQLQVLQTLWGFVSLTGEAGMLYPSSSSGEVEGWLFKEGWYHVLNYGNTSNSVQFITNITEHIFITWSKHIAQVIRTLSFSRQSKIVCLISSLRSIRSGSILYNDYLYR